MENLLNDPQELPPHDQNLTQPAKKQWVKPEMTDLTLMLGVGSNMDGETQQPGFPGLS